MKHNLREWQVFELSMLDKVVAICEEYNIKYYLSSGTLLGAIRHKGFIPWDDDIDIDMPIKDYKRFCKIAPKELAKVGCFFQTYKTDKQSSLTWAMVRTNGTTSMPKNHYRWNIHWGAHIDIFPLIGLYDNKYLRKIQYKLFGINRTLLEKDYWKYYDGVSKYSQKGWGKVLYCLPRCIRHFIVGINNLYIDRDFWKTKEASIKWWKIFPQWKHEYYTDTVKVEFEGKLYDAPIEYGKQLTLRYGDYMTPPPENERQGHELFQGETIRDLHKDYKLYQEELKREQI